MRQYYLLLGTALILTACDHYSTKMAMMAPSNSDISHDIYGIEPAAGGEMTFSGYLAQEYYQLAAHEQNVTYDYPAAKNYFEKAETLSEGQMVMLDDYLEKDIHGAETQELTQAYFEINEALREYNIPENRYGLALAHSRYDCWVDEATEGKEQSACKVQFKQAMNSLIRSYDTYSEEEFYDEFFDLEI